MKALNKWWQTFYRDEESKKQLGKLKLSVSKELENNTLDSEKIIEQIELLPFYLRQGDYKEILTELIEKPKLKIASYDDLERFGTFISDINVNMEHVFYNLLNTTAEDIKLLNISEKIENTKIKDLKPIHSSIMLKKGEASYFEEASDFYQEKTKRRVEGRSSGVSLRVVRGMSVRLGQSAGDVISYDEIAHNDSGILTITNKRIVFVGNGKCWEILLSKIMKVVLINMVGEYGVSLSATNSGKQKIVIFEDRYTHIIANKLIQLLGKEASDKSSEYKEVEYKEEDVIISNFEMYDY